MQSNVSDRKYKRQDPAKSCKSFYKIKISKNIYECIQAKQVFEATILSYAESVSILRWLSLMHSPSSEYKNIIVQL